MEIFYEVKPDLLKNSAIALGFFDGVHLGHQAVIKNAVNEAKLRNIIPTVVTFKDHPRRLTHGNSPLLLSLIEKRLSIFEALGVRAALVLTFTEELCRLSPYQYVETVLVKAVGAKFISIGYNHHFGRQREGNPSLLTEYGKNMGFAVQIAKPVFLDDIEVSSSKIRECLETAQLDLANKLLSRSFSLTGKVISGDGRGKNIGFPTANLEISTLQILPANGVYAVKVKLSDQSVHEGVVNIGYRPTFKTQQTHQRPEVEVHLLNFEGDLYGHNLELYFYKYLRAEKKFAGLDDLKEQIKIDCQMAQNLLSGCV